MSARDMLDPANSLWDLIAVQLRRHREERKISGTEVSRILDVDRSTVSRLESGGMKLQLKHAKIIDREWGTDHLFTCMVEIARTGHSAEWFKAQLDIEAKADELRVWELSWVPGLFQTERYMRAVFESTGSEEVDAFTALRLKRQELLDLKTRPVIRVLLNEGVLDQPVGGPEVMLEQIAALLDRGKHPQTTFRVVPRKAGAHIGLDGSFKLMSVRTTETVYTEACGGGRLVADGTETRSFRLRFDRISDLALPVDASTELMTRKMEGFR
ncbi:helix-turn-helix transcriptional regulator [Spirillospora sp. NPDC127200]